MRPHVRILVALSSLIVLSSAICSAIEIPLNGASATSPAPTGQSGGMNVSYIDMDAVFSHHPMTKRLKESFLQEVDKRKKEIADLQATADATYQVIVASQAAAAQQRSALAVLRLTLSSRTTSNDLEVSTAPAAGNVPFSAVDAIVAQEKAIADAESAITALQQDYERQKQDIARRALQNKEDLIALEEKNTAMVLQDIYTIIQKMADEEAVDVVFDKNNMLCGQSCKDMTQNVLDRLKGR